VTDLDMPLSEASSPPRARIVAPSTGRELQLLALAARGLTDRQIGAELNISRDTVASYWRRILLKYGSSKRTEVVARYVEQMALDEIKDTREDNVELRSEIVLRIKAQAQELAHRNLLAAITDASANFIGGQSTVTEVFGGLLQELLYITTSEYGFIGEVRYGERGAPYLHTFAKSDVLWGDESPIRDHNHLPEGPAIRTLDAIFEAVLASDTVVLSNDLVQNPVSSVLRIERQAPSSFLGIPIHCGLEMVGVIGIANRPKGFDAEIVDFLKPLVAICSTMISAYRSDQDRKSAEVRLVASKMLVRTLVDHMPSAVLYESRDRKLQFVNETFRRCFSIDVPIKDLIGMDCRDARAGCLPLFIEPDTFVKRIESIIEGEEDVLQECVLMADGRILERDFIVVRSEGRAQGYLWKYRDMTKSFKA